VSLLFTINDTGIGMNKETQAHLFTAFTQADASITRQFGGSGLGLAICANLVSLMHGSEISINSAPNQGSTFSFTLPFSIATEVTHSSSIEDLPSVPLKNLNVLVAEDNSINQMVVDTMLKRMGITPVMVNNGQEAVDTLRKQPDRFEVVLMDLQMPVMDGFEATRIIREELGLTRLPIIATTAHAMVEELSGLWHEWAHQQAH
jgi:CheY-like chemotaxis protein